MTPARAPAKPHEFIFAANVTQADDLARAQGWRPYGRASWLKSDGTEVLFLTLIEQLPAAAGSIIYVTGRLPREAGAVLKRHRARIVRIAVT